MNKSFYVYLHLRCDNNEPFYVGKGTKNRAYDKGNRNKHWHNVVNKHGYKVEILFDNLENKESGLLEIDAILELKYFGYKLVNYTNGGEGKLGYKTSEETKRKISEKTKVKKYQKNIRKNYLRHLKGE